MRFRVVATLCAVGIVSACATVPKGEPERAYISIAQRAAGPGGCDFTVKNVVGDDGAGPWPQEDGRGWGGMTRDFPPATGSLRSAATYSYATQELIGRPAIGVTSCLLIVRERRSSDGEPHLELAFELRSVDADKVEIRPRHATLRSSARWRTAAARVNVSVLFGLTDPRSRGRAAPPLDPARGERQVARLLGLGRADMGPIPLGSAVDIATAPVVLQWSDARPQIRMIAVVGERLNGRPSPDRRIMSRQMAHLGVRYPDWPPAR